MGEENENVGVSKDIEYKQPSVQDENGNKMNVFTTNYEHGASDGFGYGYQGKDTEIVVCEDNGASLIRIDGATYLYKENDQGYVERFYVYTEEGKDLQDYSYLLTTNTEYDPNNPTNLYGPNGEMVKEELTYGYKQTIKGPDGKEIEVCTGDLGTGGTYIDNPLAELENGYYTETGSVSKRETNLDTSLSEYLSGNESYSSVGSGGIFQQGLYGNANVTFPWDLVESAKRLDMFKNEDGFDSGYSYSEFCEQIEQIIEMLDKQNIFFTTSTGAQQKAELESIINTDVPQYRECKSGISINNFVTDIETYNDHVEEVKVEETKQALEAACEQYNQEKHIDHYNTVGYETDENGRQTPIYEPVYDEIHYWGWFKCIHSFLDMNDETMRRELESRGIHFEPEKRPEGTRASDYGYV